MTTPRPSLPPDVLDALQRGNIIEAIKLLRASTGLGLKEAKDAIEAHKNGKPLPDARIKTAGGLPANVMEALQRGDKIEAIRLLREQTGFGLKEAKDAVDDSEAAPYSGSSDLAPGEVPRSGKSYSWVVILIVIAVAAYFFLRNGG